MIDFMVTKGNVRKQPNEEHFIVKLFGKPFEDKQKNKNPAIQSV